MEDRLRTSAKKDIEKHLEVSRHNISTHIKDESSCGLGIIDFEEWRPLYKLNSMKKVVGHFGTLCEFLFHQDMQVY
ncbi:hypothetical protein COOONC_14158 [Cooperia oncophora]